MFNVSHQPCGLSRQTRWHHQGPSCTPGAVGKKPADGRPLSVGPRGRWSGPSAQQNSRDAPAYGLACRLVFACSNPAGSAHKHSKIPNTQTAFFLMHFYGLEVFRTLLMDLFSRFKHSGCIFPKCRVEKPSVQRRQALNMFCNFFLLSAYKLRCVPAVN